MASSDQEQKLVMPGDKIGVEEEYASSENTFVDDDGTIRSAIIGRVVAEEGRISVINDKRDVHRFRKGMFVVGTVTDDVKSVMFVKIDNVHLDGREYIALKDGKIVTQARRPQGRFERGAQRQPEPKHQKQAGVGDVVLAKILYEDPGIFTLSLNDSESGVVFSTCGLCGAEMKNEAGALSCGNCGNKTSKKISPLYNNPEEIKRLFAKAYD